MANFFFNNTLYTFKTRLTTWPPKNERKYPCPDNIQLQCPGLTHIRQFNPSHLCLTHFVLLDVSEQLRYVYPA